MQPLCEAGITPSAKFAGLIGLIVLFEVIAPIAHGQEAGQSTGVSIPDGISVVNLGPQTASNPTLKYGEMPVPQVKEAPPPTLLQKWQQKLWGTETTLGWYDEARIWYDDPEHQQWLKQ